MKSYNSLNFDKRDSFKLKINIICLGNSCNITVPTINCSFYILKSHFLMGSTEQFIITIIFKKDLAYGDARNNLAPSAIGLTHHKIKLSDNILNKWKFLHHQLLC